MNTKLILTISAILLGAIGLGLTFFPDEIVSLLNFDSSKSMTLIFQLVGALYFAFAMINWNIKDGRIGGIYNRPIALGNFTHFLIGGMALGKALYSNPKLSVLMWAVGGFYIIFALLFWIITFTHPKE